MPDLVKLFQPIADNFMAILVVVVGVVTITGLFYKFTKNAIDTFKAQLKEISESNTVVKADIYSHKTQVESRVQELVDWKNRLDHYSIMLEKFSPHYEKIEHLLATLMKSHSPFYDSVDIVLSRLEHHFKANFRNGSSVEKARTALSKAHADLIDQLERERSLINKNQIIMFLSFIKDQVEELITELDKMNSPHLKPKLISTVFENLSTTFDVFKIKLQDAKLRDDETEFQKALLEYYQWLDNKSSSTSIRDQLKAIDQDAPGSLNDDSMDII